MLRQWHQRLAQGVLRGTPLLVTVTLPQRTTENVRVQKNVVETAQALFGRWPKLNCAQALLKAFQAVSGVSDEELGDYKAMGVGKAPGNVCGALYAARLLLRDADSQAELAEVFERQAGSTLCREIRGARRLRCRDCVGVAARFIEAHADRCGPARR